MFFCKEAYKIQGGKTRTQIEKRIFRDTAAIIGERWEVEEKAIRAIAKAESEASLEEKRVRWEKNQRIKQEIKFEKKQYFKALQEKEAEKRAEIKAKRREFFLKKEEVLKLAREEMLAALVEDENLWGSHPDEMMNRKYQYYDEGKRWLSKFN